MITLHIENRQQADAIIYLLEQGIEMERLKHEIEQATNSESIESHLKIIQGEMFMSSLIASGLG